MSRFVQDISRLILLYHERAGQKAVYLYGLTLLNGPMPCFFVLARGVLLTALDKRDNE